MSDFINVQDMGMLYGGCNMLHHYHEKRAAQAGAKLDTVPDAYSPVREFTPFPNLNAAAKVCQLMGISETNYQLVVESLPLALLEDEDIRADFQDLAMKIILRQIDNMSQSRKNIEKEIASRETRRANVIARNESMMDVRNSNNTAFRKKILEETELLNVRKRKLIKTVNKMLERAGNTPNRLNPVDYKAFTYLYSLDLVGQDPAGVWCCKEPSIMDADYSDMKTISWELLHMAKE